MMAYTYNKNTKKDLYLPFPIDWTMEDINFFLTDKPFLKLVDKKPGVAKDVDTPIKSVAEVATVAVPVADGVTLPNSVPEAIPEADKAVPVNPVVTALADGIEGIKNGQVKAVHVKTGGQVERVCTVCKALFSYESKRGRPPVKCPKCKGGESA